MAFSVVMPALEMAQETGKVIAWRKREGDSVTKGEPLLEIETDKAVMEIESPADGILAGISAQSGTDIPVGQTIAWIVAPGEKPPAGESVAAAPATRAKTESHAAPMSSKASEPISRETARISPKARRLAKELGVDIATVRGSGPGGEILASDVQAAANTTAHVGTAALGRPAGDAIPSTAIEASTTIGRLMAERTTQSWTTTPHFFVTREIDATALNEYRAKLAAEIELAHKIHITHTDLLIALIARTLLQHPRLNSSWTAQGIRLHDHVNMGVAVAVNDGIVAPVIPNAHITSLPEIARQRHDLADRARAGKLRPSDISGGTFTISNLGMYRVDAFTAIIIPPQAAILAVGAIADRVIALDGKAAVRPMITLTLSCDHRVAEGARAAMFLDGLADAVRDPEKCLS